MQVENARFSRFGGVDADVFDARDVIDQVFAALLRRGNLEERVGGDVVDVNGLRRARARGKHEIDVVVGRVDGVGLGKPLTAIDGGLRCNAVAGPRAVRGRMAAVAAPRPEVHARPAHVVGVHIDGDFVRLERAHLILPRDDFRHRTAHEQSDAERGRAHRNADAGSATDARAVRGCRRGAVGGIDELRTLRGTDCGEHGLLRAVVGARRQVDPRRFHRRAEVVGKMIARQHLHPLGFGGFVVFQIAHDDEQRAVGSLRLVGRYGADGRIGNAVFVSAFVVDAHELAHVDHRLQLLLVGLPVREEDAGRSGHREQVGIGGERVFPERVLLGVGASLGVVILDEGHGQTAVVAILVVARHERPVVVVALCQSVPLAVVGGVAHGVAELEVEGCRGFSRGINPVADGLRAVPALAHAELRAGRLVVELRVGAIVALHHVVAEADVAEILEQHFQVGLHRVLHVLARVVEVGHSVPVFARVGSTCAAVSLHHVGRAHLVGHALVGLSGEVEILARQRLAMVHNHVGDGADAVVAKRLDERAQFLLGAERGIVVREPIEVVVAHRQSAAIRALRQPYEVEILAEFGGLLLQVRPFCGVERVPVEALQHHALVF